jgi:hypothetical protein
MHHLQFLQWGTIQHMAGNGMNKGLPRSHHILDMQTKRHIYEFYILEKYYKTTRRASIWKGNNN